MSSAINLYPNEAMQRSLLVLCGPPGSGKSTVEKELLERGIPKVVTLTTRPPREGEIDGVDYHFVSESGFRELARADKLLEASPYDGHWYGLSWKALEEALPSVSRDVKLKAFIILDIHGLLKLRTIWPGLWSIWLDASNRTLRGRLYARGWSPEKVEARMQAGLDQRSMAMCAGCTFSFNTDNASSVMTVSAVAAVLDLMRARFCYPHPLIHSALNL